MRGTAQRKKSSERRRRPRKSRRRRRRKFASRRRRASLRTSEPFEEGEPRKRRWQSQLAEAVVVGTRSRSRKMVRSRRVMRPVEATPTKSG